MNMLKQIRIVALALLTMGLMVSCQNADQDVRDAARQNIESGSVQPADQAGPQSASAPESNVPTGPTTEMSFEETEYDFGTVVEGEKVRHVYKFTNTGEEPLVISDAKGSCGCTVPEWPREPIAPGKSGQVTVEFNSRNKRGDKNQKVTITANTNPPQTFIYLKGTVQPKDDATSQLNN